jgi:exodeoxyribonuclease VII small subunit
LDESIALYARGDKLRAQCEARLKAAQARIDKLQIDADGKPVGTEPLDPD